MPFKGKKILVTGGAGFIGSHLVRVLLELGWYVKVIDNLSTGRLENLKHYIDDKKLSFVKLDLRNQIDVTNEVKEIDVVFHLAADPEVRTSIVTPVSHYENNLLATLNVLEAMRLNGVKELLFTSSSTVYGDAEILPTPEDYFPMKPISIYGATKLACEALICGYANTFNIKCLVLRPANIVGSNSTHGVILDFITKLKKNPHKLVILGDGAQRKSYLHVSDFVEAVMKAYAHSNVNNLPFEVYNVGNTNTTSVMDIASIVVEEMGLKNVSFELTGGVDGGRGWKGDVKTMLLSIKKIESIGWKPSQDGKEALRLATRELLSQLKVLHN